MAAARLSMHRLHAPLEDLYLRYNRRVFVDHDPLAVVYRFQTPEDREAAGLIAAALAFGSVTQILRALDTVFEAFPAPGSALRNQSSCQLQRRLGAFRYRFVTENDLLALMQGMQALIREHGSLGAAFRAAVGPDETTVVPALTSFVNSLNGGAAPSRNYLLPDPSRGSACKRLFMYLRWMVRSDDVDLGLWPVSPRLLVVPMDTHMHRMALALGLTRRKQADLKAALEVTAAFRKIAPHDPVRYDFALTRLGIRKELTPQTFLDACRRI